MRKIEDIYKDYNEKIMPSEKLDDMVLNETIYKKSNDMFWKKSLISVSIFLVVSITTIGIVFAKEIKEVIQKYFVTTVISNTSNENIKPIDKKFMEVKTLKEINYDALLPETDWETRYDFKNKPKIKLGELETKLETKFLHFKEDENQDIIIMGLEKANDKIGNVELQTTITNDINVYMRFVTKYSENFQNGFSIRLGTGTVLGSEIYLNEYSDILNTDIYYMISSPDKEDYENRLTRCEAIFVYDDVAYQLVGTNISKNMLTEIIESIQLDEED